MHKILAESDQLRHYSTRQADPSVKDNFANSSTKPSTASPPASDIVIYILIIAVFVRNTVKIGVSR